MVYWSFLHVHVPLKGDHPLCSGKYFQSKVREENGRPTSKPAWCWCGGAEAQRKRSLFTSLLHRPRLVHQSAGPAAPGGHSVKQSYCLSLFPKNPLPIRREEKQ